MVSIKKKPETSYDFTPGTKPVVVRRKPLPRIGIYAGSFDPVHEGHIVFALKAQKLAGLEQIYFVPERRPLHDSDPEHVVHRSVMLSRALKPYARFHVFDIPDARLNARSITRVIDGLPEANLSLLTTASEILWYENDLPGLYHKLHLVVAVTSGTQMVEVLSKLTDAGTSLGNITFVDIGTDHISSAEVRRSIRAGKQIHGLLPSVWRYAHKQWLYLPPIRNPHR